MEKKIVQNSGEGNAASMEGYASTFVSNNVFNTKIDEINENINSEINDLNQLFSDINNLKTDIDKLKIKQNPKTIFFWVSGFSALFSIVALCGSFIYKDTVILNESIVLIFVGILATFVVVSNYIQVNSIEKKFDEKIKEVDEKFDRKAKAIEEKFNDLSAIQLYTLDAYLMFFDKEYKDSLDFAMWALKLIVRDESIVPEYLSIHTDKIIGLILLNNTIKDTILLNENTKLKYERIVNQYFGENKKIFLEMIKSM